MTARWAIAGTYVTEFGAPIEIVFSNPAGGPVIPATSPAGDLADDPAADVVGAA